MQLIFNSWKIAAGPWDARQYDNGVWELLLTGELPAGWSWQALIAQGDKLDIIDLETSEQGASATLTAENLALTGHYSIQIRGTNGEKVRHTNLVQVFVPRSLSGDARWPVLPTEFTQAEKRIDEKVQKAEAAAAHSPTISDAGTWLVWDAEKGKYVDTGTSATEPGPQGVSGPKGDPGETFVVTVKYTSASKYTADKTYAEILSAYEDGQQVNARIVNYPGVVAPSTLPLFVYTGSNFIFSGAGALDGQAMTMTAICTNDTWETALKLLADPESVEAAAARADALKPLIVSGKATPNSEQLANTTSGLVGNWSFTPGADFDFDTIDAAYKAGRLVYLAVTGMAPFPVMMVLSSVSGSSAYFCGQFVMTPTYMQFAILIASKTGKHTLYAGNSASALNVQNAAVGKMLQIGGYSNGYITRIDAVNPTDTWKKIDSVTLDSVFNPTDTDQIKWETVTHVIPTSGGVTAKYITGLKYTFKKAYKKVRFTFGAQACVWDSGAKFDLTGYIYTKGVEKGGSETTFPPIIEAEIFRQYTSPVNSYVEIDKVIGDRHRAMAILLDHPANKKADGTYFGRTVIGGVRADNYGASGDILGIGFGLCSASTTYLDGRTITLEIEGIPA